jgi:hypothetical protein
MSALTDRSTNAQPTSDPASTEGKAIAEGTENKPQDQAQQKFLNENRYYYRNITLKLIGQLLIQW